MWPHSFDLALGDAVVGVGTDDDEIAALLAPFALPDDSRLPSIRTPDFGLELHPDPPVHRAQPRALPSLQHGTLIVGRSGDVAPLRDGLLRTLASVGPAEHGTVRLTGLPLLVEGGVILAPPEVADRGSLRRLRNTGHTPIYVPSVSIDPAGLTVHLPAPFGTDAAPTVAPLLQWWLPLHADDPVLAVASLSVGQLVAHAVHRMAAPWFEDELDGPAADAVGTARLAALVALVAALPPQVGKFVT